MNFDDFLSRENVSRYRRILGASTSKVQQQIVLRLLAEEMSKSAKKSKIGGGDET